MHLITDQLSFSAPTTPLAPRWPRASCGPCTVIDMNLTAPALPPPRSILALCRLCWKSALISPRSAPNRPKNSRIRYSIWQSQFATGPNKLVLSAAHSYSFPARIPEQDRSFTKALRTLPLLLDQKKSSLRHSGRSETRLKNGSPRPSGDYPRGRVRLPGYLS